MVILGLTGSIGMGKSTAAAMLQRMGMPVHDADATVHRLLGPGGAAVAAVGAVFPDAVADGAVDRAALGKRVFQEPQALRQLEAILHPLVRQTEQRFLRQVGHRRAPIAILDIPLLFETGGESRVDATIVVSAPAMVQTARVLRRPGMTEERLAAVRRKQMGDREKRRRADFVVLTGLGKRVTLRMLKAVLRRMSRRRGRHWPPNGYRQRSNRKRAAVGHRTVTTKP